MKSIKKTIDIQAPKEKVWRVLTEDALLREWYNEFMPGAYAETDEWKPDSKIKFLDTDGNGMVGRVVENEYARVLSVEVLGNVIKGEEDYDSDEVKSWQGSRETYHLSEADDNTTLRIETGMSEEYYDRMSQAWDQALVKIKELSENLPD